MEIIDIHNCNQMQYDDITRYNKITNDDEPTQHIDETTIMRDIINNMENPIAFENLKDEYNTFEWEIKDMFTDNKLKFNGGADKITKHQPARSVRIATLKDYTDKFKKSNTSFTNLNFDLPEFKKYILETIKRRINLLNSYDYNKGFKSNTLKWYDETDIKTAFPEFYRNNRCYYEKIYQITTENMHNFIYKTNNIPPKYYMCEHILLCIAKNKYNIMFHTTFKHEIKNLNTLEEVFYMFFDK